MSRIAEVDQNSLELPLEAPHAERARSADNSDRLWTIAIGAMVVVQLWFGMIATSFWLDEAGTWWVVKDGAVETVHRAFAWSGQSPLFYLIEWLSSRIFGLNEIALRIPSVLAMMGALYFIYRIAERVYDRASAVAVAFVFLCAASFYAVDARPYALALLCLNASVWALLRWLDTNRLADALLYVIAGTLLIYAHCILGLGLVAGAVCGIATARKEPRRLAWLGLMEISIALLCLPLLGELRRFYATRATHAFATLPSSGDILNGFIPCSLAGASIVVVWIFMGFRGKAPIAGKCTKSALALIWTWALFAPLFLFLLPVVSDLRLFLDRYYSSALPGQALLAGGLLASIPRGARKALILLLGAGSILVQGKLTVNSHGNDDWRSAMAFVKAEAGFAPVLMVSPFAEGTDFRSLGNPELREVLFAPEAMYGEPLKAIRLPHAFAERETAALESVTSELKNEPRFYLLNDKPDRSYEIWLLGRFGSSCKSERVELDFGYVWLSRFTCEKRK